MNIGLVIDVYLNLVCTWFDKSLDIWFASGLHPNIHYSLALICMWFGHAKHRRNQKPDWPNHMQTNKKDFVAKHQTLLLGIEPGSNRYVQSTLPLSHVFTLLKLNESDVYIYTFMHIKIR